VRKFYERIFPRARPRIETRTRERHLKTASNRRRGSKLSSTSAVYAALIGDVLVAVSKVGAAIWTGSAAMSEAIHSIVDTTNEILLLYGIHRSRRKADPDHPFGYGRELYFWSFVVSLLIFAFGAGFSIYEGVNRIRYPTPIQGPIVSYVVLALAFLFEGGSWLYSLRQFRRAKGNLGFFEAFKLSKDPPSFMTLFEDSVALIGILIAAGATFAAVAIDRPEFDGAGSIALPDEGAAKMRRRSAAGPPGAGSAGALTEGGAR
jgi:divalent metal cation (Fe/Co/Zn/Cd) transporter